MWNHSWKEFLAVNQRKKNEKSRNESSTSNLEDVFAEGLKNPDCVLVRETFDLSKKSKGELALQEVTKAISFIGKTFDAYEQKERKMKKNWRIEWNSI